MSRPLDEETAKKELVAVSGHADKNQRLAWRRKKVRMEELRTRIEPISEKMLELILEKQPIMDEIEKVRQTMVKECVHPEDYLVHKGDHIVCKFCRNLIKLNGK